MPQNCDQGLLDSLITFSDTSRSSLKELETKVLSQIAIKSLTYFVLMPLFILVSITA